MICKCGCTGKTFGGVGEETLPPPDWWVITDHAVSAEYLFWSKWSYLTCIDLNHSSRRQLMRFLTDLAHSADMIGFSDLGLPKEAVAITSVPDIHQSICWLVLCLVISRAKSVSETFYSCFPQSLLWVLSGCWFRLTECSVLTTLSWSRVASQ